MPNRWSEQLEIGPFSEADLAAATRIEAASPSAWSGPAIRLELGCTGGLQWAARLGGDCVGWCCCRWVEAEAELLKISVAPERRRQGIAGRLLEELLFELARRRIQRLFLEVRAANLAARSLYRKYGFTEIGRRTNYYGKPQDDALVLSKSISTGRRHST